LIERLKSTSCLGSTRYRIVEYKEVISYFPTHRQCEAVGPGNTSQKYFVVFSPALLTPDHFNVVRGKQLSAVSNNELTDQPAALRPGAILQDRYCIVRPLGQGGMGAVYEAIDQRLDTTVALKETLTVDSNLRKQFAHEAKLLAKLQHPALPRVSDYFTEGDRAFLVMQFVSGIDLAQIIAKHPGRPFPQHQVIAWADQLLDAVIYLHTRERQIVHRDIKPHNLKLTAAGRIALLDFGLAKTQSSDHSTTNSSASIFGYTRRYSPLEQIEDRGTTPRSDIYALGATLYHLLTGVKPPDALVRAAALVESKKDPLRPANEIHRTLGAEIAGILNRALAQNPEDRFADATEFREALRQLGRTDQVEEKRATQPPNSDLQIEARHDDAGARTSSAARDPFESYSILKPDDRLWLVPGKRHAPNIIAAILVVLLLVGLAGSYGYRRWLANSTALDSVKTADQMTIDPATLRHSKLDRSHPNSGSNGVPAEARSTVAQKRVQVRRENSETNLRKASVSSTPRPRRASGDLRSTTSR
jgi:serine/threonine protein kinase